MDSAPRSVTEHLTIAELLGSVPTDDTLPDGWAHPKAIAQVEIGTEVFIKNLRTKDWELGTVQDYWERGGFLDVICGKRCQMVFTSEHIAVKSSGG